MAKVIERVQSRYEVEEVEFGKVYKWCPEHIVVECQCGQKLSHCMHHLLRGTRYRSYASRQRGIGGGAPEQPNPPPLALLLL